MRAQDHHVFAAAAIVLLAPGVDLEEIAEEAVVDGFFEMKDGRGEAHLVGDGDFSPVFGSGGEDFIGFDQIGCERFFRIEMRAGFYCRQTHFAALIGPPRRDSHKLRLLFRQHLAVTFVLPQRLAPLHCLGASFGDRIGDGEKLNIISIGENLIHRVAVIAVAGVADDGGGEPWHGRLARGN